jgi:hypothetical protein
MTVTSEGTLNLNLRMVIDSNLALLAYFTNMAKNKDPEVKINLEFVESLLNNGADINIADVYGQTLLHEVRLPVVSGNDVHGDDGHDDN